MTLPHLPPLTSDKRIRPADEPEASAPLLSKQQKVVYSSRNQLNDITTVAVENKYAKDAFLYILAVFQITLIVLHSTCSLYLDDPNSPDNFRYPYFQDIHVMMFVGFGFLMTFLRRYGYSSIGFTLLITAMILQWNPLLDAFWSGVFTGNWVPAKIGVVALINADFSAAAVLISFGVIIGKVSPTQLVLLAMIEPILYNLNNQIGILLSISDVGGSIVIHAFGAFFGIAATYFLTPEKAKVCDDNSAVYRSDMFAMVGTVFLWMYWPSFNGGLASADSFTRAVVNTVLALSGSCVAAFLCSYLFRTGKRFAMVDIQNATLAGGVAVGATADMPIGVGAALGLGCIAGCISTFGFAFIQPILDRKLGIHDTCGVFNLHLMPSVLGGIASSIAAASFSAARFSDEVAVARQFPKVGAGLRTFSGQGAAQIEFLFITIAIASVSGMIVGKVLSHVRPARSFYMDSSFWEVPGEELPMVFTHKLVDGE